MANLKAVLSAERQANEALSQGETKVLSLQAKSAAETQATLLRQHEVFSTRLLALEAASARQEAELRQQVCDHMTSEPGVRTSEGKVNRSDTMEAVWTQWNARGYLGCTGCRYQQGVLWPLSLASLNQRSRTC